MRIAVVGGGITGLAAAYELSRGSPAADVVLFEASDRLGGKVRSSPFAGRLVDEGADAFLARVPWAVELCEELGLRRELVSPAVRNAYIWSGGRLRPLPDGNVLGVPTDLDALAASGLVSPAGLRRAAEDLDLIDPPRAEADESVGSLIRRRLGDEVLERLVDPLLGGINAGDTDRLSVAAGAPQLDAAARAAAGGSLIAALRAQRDATATAADAPVFFTVPGGVERLVTALADAVGGAPRVHTAVEAIERAGHGWSVNGEVFDGVVLATPSFAAAPLVAPFDPRAADLLRAVSYASVVLVTLAYPARAVDRPLDASGFLVPRGEGLALTACSWASSKWAHLGNGDGDDTVVLRASVGRFGDERATRLDDDSLLARVVADLQLTMGVDGDPAEIRISRWPQSFPQYEPGHLDRVDEVEAGLAESAPGLVVAGAAYRGLGVPACIRQGREAARRLLCADA